MDLKTNLILLILLGFITGCVSNGIFNFGSSTTKTGIGINLNFKEGQPRTDRISETAGFKVTPVITNYIPEDIPMEICLRDTWESSKGGIEQPWDCQGIIIESAVTETDDKTKEEIIRAPMAQDVDFPRYFYQSITDQDSKNQYTTDIIAKAIYPINTLINPRFTVPAGSSRFTVSGNELSTATKYLPITVSNMDIVSNEEGNEAELDLTINLNNQGGGKLVDETGKETDIISVDIQSPTSEIKCQKTSIKLIGNKAEINCVALMTNEIFPTNFGLEISMSYNYQIETKLTKIPIVP